MKHTHFLLAVLLTALLFAAGCRSRNVTQGMAEGESYDAVISVNAGKETAPEPSAETQEGGTKTPAASEGGLSGLIALMGKTDEEASQMLGQGEENRTQDGNYLVGRIYQTTLFDRACSVYTSYGEDGTVELAVAQFSPEDASACRQGMEQLLGSGSAFAAEELPEEGEGFFWIVENLTISLFISADSVNLDISTEKNP